MEGKHKMEESGTRRAEKKEEGNKGELFEEVFLSSWNLVGCDT